MFAVIQFTLPLFRTWKGMHLQKIVFSSIPDTNPLKNETQQESLACNRNKLQNFGLSYFKLFLPSYPLMENEEVFEYYSG